MARPTEPLREEHKGLLPHIVELRETADRVGEIPWEEEQKAVERSYRFLTGHLRPHAEAEEKVLYPLVEKLMSSSDATATMKRDHVEIIRLTTELGALLGGRREAPRGAGGSDPESKQLRHLLYGLNILVKIHFDKEEEVYLPLIDSRLSADEVKTMYAAMEQAAGEAMRRAA